MAAQHKRHGRTAKEERRRRAQQRAQGKQVKVIVFRNPKPAMYGPGRVVAIGEVV